MEHGHAPHRSRFDSHDFDGTANTAHTDFVLPKYMAQKGTG